MKITEKHQAITNLKSAKQPIAMLCQLFEVSQSGYYASLQTTPSPRQIRRNFLTMKITNLFQTHKSRYGRPRIYRQLRNEGESISEKMVGRIMRAEGLQARKKQAFRPKTTHNISRAKYSPNLLRGQPKTTAPNQVIVADITYVATKQGWLYLAAVMDLHSKVIKGYAIQETMHTDLIIQAYNNAIKRSPNLRGCVHHSDRGCQYTSAEYLEKLSSYQIKSSMSAKGNCYDNAAMESFWSTLKTEGFPESGVFETKSAAKQAIFEYIEAYYHTQRMHSSLGYITPLAAENFAKQAA